MTVGIFGAGRDGSTLLMRLLDGTPGLWIYPLEIKPFDQLTAAADLARLRAEPSRVGGARVPAEWLERWARFQLDELDRLYVAGLEEPFAPARPESLRPPHDLAWHEVFHWFLTLAREAYGGEGEAALAFKSTEAFERQLYERALADLRTVSIVRHPLEQYASTKRTVLERPGFLYWARYTDVLSAFVERWLAHARSALAGTRRDPQRHLLVRYEDIRADAQAEVERIAAWLGVEPPAEPAVQTVLSGRRMTELPRNPSKAGVRTPERVVPDMAAQFGYEDVVAERERAIVCRRTRALAAELGYDVPAPSLGGLALAARWLPPAGWELRQVRQRRSAAKDILHRRAYAFRSAFGR